MIDEKATFKMFGYTSDELKRFSGKPCVRRCDKCGECKILPKRKCGPVCHACAMCDPVRGVKISAANSGENHALFGKRGEECPNFGSKRSEETRRRMSAAQIGENHPNWQGGKSGWRNAVWRTKAYKNWRAAVFERDDYTCQMCDTRGGYLEAHHIRPVRDHKNDLESWDIDNGITLCKQCHDTTKQKENEFIERFEDMIEGGK